MENQDLLNSISTLCATIDTLSRAGKSEEITIVVKKLIELVEKLK